MTEETADGAVTTDSQGSQPPADQTEDKTPQVEDGESEKEPESSGKDGLENDRAGSASDRYRHVREAQQRFRGDSVQGDKIVFYLSGGELGSPLRPLSPTLEMLARYAFVPPAEWDTYRNDFRDRRTVLLRGTAGHGRGTMAIRLLQTVEAGVIYELDPGIDLARMAEQIITQPIPKGAAFLLCQPDGIARLDAYTFHSLESALVGADARLVITVGPETSFGEDLLSQQMTLPEAPSRREILLRHLSHHLEEEDRAAEILERAEVAEVVAETLDRDGVTCEVTAALALLLSRSGDRIDAARIRRQLRRRETDGFELWFDGLPDLETRCFATALAVLDGLPYEDVADAARALNDRLASGGPVVLDASSRLRVSDGDPFRTSPVQLLRTLQARTVETEVQTPNGPVPATGIAYRDPRYAEQVISRVWKGYRVQDELLDWLHELVSSWSETVRVYAGTTVGVLTRFNFDYLRRRVLLDWAGSEEQYDRDAAADALREAAADEALRPAVTRLVDSFYRAQGAERRCTAALALGTRLGEPDPARSIRKLEQLTVVDDLKVRVHIGRGFAALLVEDSETSAPLFYGVLERCLESSRRTATAEVVFLVVAKLLATTVVYPDGTTASWPTLLDLARNHGHLRRPLFRMWARVLAGGSYVYMAEQVLREWAGAAEPDARIREVFTRMVRAVHDIDPWAGSAIERMTRGWNSDDEINPMPNVARAVGALFDDPGTLER